MADTLQTKKLSELPLAPSVNPTDVFIGQTPDLSTKRFPLSILRDFMGSVFTPPGSGGIAQLANAKLSRATVNPEDYGAVGDGVTDDTAAFQRAINYLRVNGGGTVDFNGRYVIDGPLYIEDYVSLRGRLGNPGELRYDGTSDYDGKRSLLLVNSASTITPRSGATVGNCLVMRKGMNLPFADATAAAAGVAAFAGTAFTAGGSDVKLHDMMILGFNTPFVTNGFERPILENVKCDNTNGPNLAAIYDIGNFDKVHCWPFTTTHQSWTTGPLNLRSGTGLALSNVADMSNITNSFAYGYAIGASVDGCNMVNLSGFVADGYGAGASTAIGVYIKGISKHTTLMGVRTAAQGRSIVIDCNTTGIEKAATVDIVGCKLWDCDIKHIDILSGRVNVVGSSFWRGPVGIDCAATNGRVNVDLCDFEDITGNTFSTGSFDNMNIGPSNRFTNCVNNFGERSVVDANGMARKQYSGSTATGVGTDYFRSRGTTALKTALVANDLTWAVNFNAHDGTNFLAAGGMRQAVDVATGTGNIQTKLIFALRKTGAAAAADMWVMNGDGSLSPTTNATNNFGSASFRIATVFGANADFSGKAKFSALGNYASDAAAATGGVGIGELYHNAGAVRVRLT